MSALTILALGLAVYLSVLALILIGAWRRSGLPLSQALRAGWQAPRYTDPGEDRLTQTLASILRETFLIVIGMSLLLAVTPVGAARLLPLVLGGWLAGAHVGLYVLIWRRRARLARALYPLLLFLIVTLGLALSGGFHGAGASAYLLVIIAAGMLQGAVSAGLYAAASSLLLVAVSLLESLGLIVGLTGPGLQPAWLMQVAVFVMSAVMLRLAAQRLAAELRHVDRLRAAETAQAQELAQALAAECKHAQHLELLNDFARGLTALSDPQALMNEAARRLCQSFGFEAAAVYLVEDDALITRATFGLFTTRRVPGQRVRSSQGVVGWVSLHGESCWIEDPAADARCAPDDSRGLAGIVVVPLRLAKSVVGVLEVASTDPSRFDATDVRTLESLSDLVVAGLQTNQLIVQLRHRQRLTEGLRRIGAAVNTSLESSTVLNTLCAETCAVFQAGRVEVWLADDDQARLTRAAGCGRLAASAKTGQPEAGLDVDAQVAQSVARGRALLFPGDGRPARSLVVAPLRTERGLLGALVIAEAERAARFTPEESGAAELLGAQVAAALDNARLFASGQRRAGTLGLLNAITQAALEVGELPALFDVLTSRLAELLGADACLLALRGAGGELALASAAGEQANAAGPSVAWEALTTAALDAGQPLAVPDVQRSYYALTAPTAPDAARAVFAVPLLAGEERLGAALLMFRQPRSFAPDELSAAEQAGRQLALALARVRALEAERRRSAELETLRAASLRLTSSLELTQVLEAILQQTLTLVGASDAHIFLYDGHTLTFGAALWAEGHREEPFTTARRGGLTETVALTGQRLAVTDVNRHQLFNDWRWGGAIVGLPLRMGQRVCGVMNVAYTRPHVFDEGELRILDLLADQAAVALENARLFESERRQRELAVALHEASIALSTTLEIDTVLDRLLDQAARIVPCDAASLLVLDADSQGARMVRHRELEGLDSEASDLLASPDQHISLAPNLRWLTETHRPLLIADTREAPGWVASPIDAYLPALLGVPIVAQRKVIACFVLRKREPGHFQPFHAQQLSALAGQAALALQNARLFDAERRRAAQLALLSEVSQQVADTLDEAQLLQRAAGALVNRLGFSEAAIMLPAEAGELTVVALAATEAIPVQIGFRLKMGTGAAGHAALTRSTYLANNIAEDPYYFDSLGRSQGSALALPLLREGQLLGMIYVETGQPQAFSPVDVVALETLAQHVATALQNARLYAAQRRRAEEERLLLSAARDLSAGLSQEAVLNAAVRHVTAALQASSSTVSLWDRDADRVVTLLDYALPPSTGQEAGGTPYPLARYPQTRRVLEQRLAVIVAVDDPAADPAEVAYLRAHQNGSALLLPLLAADKVYGLLEVFRLEGQPAFTETDLQLGQRLAAQAGVALENARLHTAVQENLREQDALLKASEALLSTLELEPLLQNILAAAITAIPPAEKGAVILADPQQRLLTVRAAHGYRDQRVQGLYFPIHQGYPGRALRENQPLLVADAAVFDAAVWPKQLPEQLPELSALRSAIVAPLAPKGADGPPLGVISLGAARPNTFTRADLRRLVAFANTAAVAIDNAQLHAEVQRLAVTDSLTGLANPRAFEHALATEFHRAGRYGYALSLVIMDIDSFKEYNDTYGHPAGNERLKAIAGILRANVRDPDLPVRYGGEEFALLLPHTTKAGALALAERVRTAAEAVAGKGARPGRPISGYSLSLGVASFPNDALTAEELLLAADNAELAAKRGGKNRVIAAAPLPEAARSS
ncbi:MAG: GAF domain-containing protein [Anaerolineales bacterium]|nr:GAF domain-containing protein [Anaerolineales bacterium]